MSRVKHLPSQDELSLAPGCLEGKSYGHYSQ